MTDTMTTSKKEEQQQRRKKKQQELDSILDAALDELEDDSSSDSTEEENEAVPTAALNPNYSNFDYNGGDSSQTNNAAAATAAAVDNGNTMGVPYSLEYLANNPHGHNETNNRRNNNHHRPKFGPEPPPQPSPALQPSSSLDQHGLSAEEANLAASLEGMMKQFASGLDAAGVDFNNEKDMADLEHAEKALEEMFKQMMMGDAAAGSGMAMPSTPPPSSNAATGGDAVNGQSKKSSTSKSSSTTGKNSTKKSSSNPKNQKESNEKTESNNNDVDESINRLLDGINQASSSQQTTMPTTTIPPNNNNNIDPSSSQLEHLSEQMISSLMNDFEQSTSKKDSNDIIDNVMKQLLDKELMYQPMKEVCTRYPKWLANNKDSLPPDEYQKYGTQYQYFQRIVRLYETEPNNFERLMELMQDIQEYGQPPVEIIRELAPELKFDEEGMPVMDVMGDGSGGMMPGMPFPMMGGGTGAEQCCIS